MKSENILPLPLEIPLDNPHIYERGEGRRKRKQQFIPNPIDIDEIEIYDEDILIENYLRFRG